jgi:prolyl oligopeptidase
VSEDGQYLVIALRQRSEPRTRMYFIDLDNPKRPNLSAPIVKLFDAGDALYEFVASEGPLFFIRTTRNAPRARVVAVDINAADENHWTTVVRESYDALIEARRVDDRIVAHRLHDAHSTLDLYSLDGGGRGTIALPGVGTVTALTARPEARELYYTFTSFLQAPVAYRFDLDTRNSIAFREMRPDTTLMAFETTQLFYTSKDGTRVPMFITARRGTTLNGTLSTLLEADGSFGHSATPRFSPMISTWLQNGGVYAVANVRGGGEYGRLWHDAARGSKKQTSVDDLIAAAEFLIGQRYTRAASLGVIGGGDGGLLAGAAITQRPELFGAAAIEGGLLDLVRYPRFTIGWTWTSEFGSPDVPAELRVVSALSPLNAVRAGTRYPATLVTAGDYDDVIPPAHSYKFAAALQSSQAGAAPILLRSDPDIGHGPGIPTARQIAIDADRLVFLINTLRPH